MKKNLYYIFIILLATGVNRVSAQSGNNSIEVAPFYGLQMFSAENNTLKGTSFGLEGAYHINMQSNPADWVRMLNVRDVSVALSYRDYQNVSLTNLAASQGILGNYYSAIAHVDFILANAGKTQLLLDPGFGFGYATQTYYTNNNPMVGSHINFTAQIGLKLATPVSASTRLVGGLDLFHFSNAAFKNPNDGVNSINVSVGIDHDIDQVAPKGSSHPFQNYKKSSFEFGVDIGRRGLVQTGGGISGAGIDYQKSATSQLYQSGLYLGYNYRLNPVLSLRLGLDAVYYYKTLDTIADIHHFYATYQELGSSYDRFRVGTSIGTELWLGRLSLPLNLGYYIHYHYFVPTNANDYQPPKFYWTFGARYYFTPSFAVEAKQYLHRTQADFAGFGIIVKI